MTFNSYLFCVFFFDVPYYLLVQPKRTSRCIYQNTCYPIRSTGL